MFDFVVQGIKRLDYNSTLKYVAILFC